jgi:two-component system, NarL family, invasion response regulator UvrY
VKILVVDDNEAIRSGLCELLERADPNYRCESASDGNEALIKAKVSKPDVVILDFSMPGMGGLSSARLISHRLPGIKILLHTAHRDDMLEANASRFGVFRIVDKTDGRNVLAIIREIDSNSEEG